MKGILLSMACISCTTGLSQGILSVDKTEISIGDQIQASIRVDLSEGREWTSAGSTWPDSLAGIEIVSGPIWNRDDVKNVKATWTIALFDTGWVRIPSLPVVLQQGDQLDTVFTNDVPVKVLPVEPDSTGLKPIKEIYVQPFSLGYYKKYLPHLLGLLLVLGGFIFWYRQRKRKAVVPEAIPIPPLPHAWAYRALDDLAERKLWQRGEVKEHYTLLTAILREYLERRYNIHALEQTSDEIIVQLRKQDLHQALLMDTQELLSIADLIKFAKADPGMDIHAATIERVRSFVKETAFIPNPSISDSQKPVPDGMVG